MSSSTASLLTALAGKEAGPAWSALADRHGADVWRLINSRLRDPHAAEDAYQEFWLALPAAARRFKPQGPDPERRARAWLLHIAYTTAIDQHRRRRPDHLPVADTASQEDAMSGSDQRDELVEQVRSAVERLPETHRQPLLLHFVAGLSYDDLASELRCTVNNARVKVHRGLAALRGLVGGEPGRLSEQTLAGLIAPVTLLVPPPPPPALPPPPPPGMLLALAKGPVLISGAIATATTAAIATAVIVSSPHSPPEPPVSPIRTIAATAAATATLAAAVSGDDFNRDTAGMNCHDATVTADLVDAPTGIGSGKSLRISWQKEHKNFVQCEYVPLRPAPEITADGTGVVTLKVWIEAMSGVTGVCVRFTDAKNETFQWTAKIPDPDQTGWRSIAIPIIPDQNKGHWGPPNQSDGVIDWPVRLNGYAFGFANDKIPAGVAIVDDVVLSVATADKP